MNNDIIDQLKKRDEAMVINTKTFVPTCPICGAGVLASSDGSPTKQHFCFHCGQRLGW